MSMKKKPTDITVEPTEPIFGREALLDCKRFRHERDLVSALLKEGEEYSISEVERMIAKYKKGEVK